MLPLIVLEGRPGAFLQPLATAYLVAVVVAALVAVTLTPALGTVLPPKERRDQNGRGGRVSSAVGRIAGTPVIAAALVGSLISRDGAPFLSRSVVPDLDDHAVLVRLASPSGTSNVKMTEIATELSSTIRDIEGVNNVGASVGRAVTGDRIVDVNAGGIMVSIDQDADYDETVDEIRTASKDVEGAEVKVSKYLDDRVEHHRCPALRPEHHGGPWDGRSSSAPTSPSGSACSGRSSRPWRTRPPRSPRLVNQVQGVRNATVEKPEQQPTLEIEVDLDKASTRGVKPGDARRAEAIIVQGILVGSVFQDQKVFDVVVQGNPDIAKNPDAVRNLLIDRPDGGHVRLSRIADIREGTSPTVIERDEVSRKVDITMDVSGRSVASVSEELEKKLQDIDMPLQYHAKVIDKTLAEEIDRDQSMAFALAAALGRAAAVAGGGAQLASGRARLPRLFPSALLGGVVALLLLGDGLTIATGAGLLAVFALAVRHTVLGP